MSHSLLGIGKIRLQLIYRNKVAQAECLSQQQQQRLCSSSTECCRRKYAYADRFPPLFEPLSEHIPTPSPSLPDFLQYPTNITTLPNGLRIASQNAPGPAACVGLYVDSGSIYETPQSQSTGVTHLLERMAFKTTKHRTHLQILHQIEEAGGHVGASASREQMGYTYDTLKTYLPQAIQLLIDTIRNPLFLNTELKEQVNKIKREVKHVTKDPQQYLIESLHLCGYKGSLGNPLIPPEDVLDNLEDGSIVGKFYHENYTSNRMVLAGFGVEHEEFVAMVEPLLHDLPQGPPLVVPEFTYTGGDIRQHANLQSTHVALAFEVPGGWNQDKDATTLTLIQTLMGGGGSFSAGGPGKGMHSRLYLGVLNVYRQIENFSAFSSMCNESGIFGIHLTTGSNFVAKAVEVAANELQALATPGKVSEVELSRAKNATKSAVLMNLESRMISAEDIGRQILTYGHRKPVDHFLKCLDELTVNDITNLAQRMLSSPLSMASLGDVNSVPNYDYISRRFRA